MYRLLLILWPPGAGIRKSDQSPIKLCYGGSVIMCSSCSYSSSRSSLCYHMELKKWLGYLVNNAWPLWSPRLFGSRRVTILWCCALNIPMTLWMCKCTIIGHLRSLKGSRNSNPSFICNSWPTKTTPSLVPLLFSLHLAFVNKQTAFFKPNIFMPIFLHDCFICLSSHLLHQSAVLKTLEIGIESFIAH